MWTRISSRYFKKNHKKALELVFTNIQNNEEFDETFIKRINETINKDIKDTKGYRKVQVFIEFEKIHPFEDGNGRTGRLIINYELIKKNLPPVVITKEDRVKYFDF